MELQSVEDKESARLEERPKPDPRDTAQATSTVNSNASKTAIQDKEELHHTPEAVDDGEAPAFKPDRRFWIILSTLAILLFIATLENSIIGTALPFIVDDLDIGANYIWVAHVQLLTGTVLMPLVAQLANIFGRRWVMIVITAFFILGCTLCGAATNESMMLAGRAIQGIASQNCVLLTEMIISDLVPLRERAKYIGMSLSLVAISVICGPILSGFIVDNTTWRWIFYLNLPIAGVALVLLYIFLRVKWNRNESVMTKLKRIDWVGNILVAAASTSFLLGLTWADTIHPWDSAPVLAPVIIGFLGLVAFILWEQYGASEPVIPLRIFSYSAILLYVEVFLSNFCLFFPAFFLPLFFQAVLLSTPARAGVQLIPYTAFMFPSVIATSILLPKLGRYKIFHLLGFAFLAAGQGLFATLDKDDSTAQWVCKTLLQPIGTGFIAGSFLPALQSWTSEADMAAVTAGFTYIRSMALVFGIAIPSTIFNTYAARYSSEIEDESARAMFTSGNAFALGTKAFITSYDQPVQSQIRDTFQRAIRVAFQSTIAFAGVGFIIAAICKDNKLRSELETQYGLEESKKKEGTVEKVV